MTKSVHELSDEFKISVRKLNAMAKAGYLTLAPGKREVPAQMRYYLAKGRMLTAEHLLMLARAPELIEGLGNHSALAEKQLRSLGDIAADSLGAGFSYSLIYGAFIADQSTLETLTAWLSRVIPIGGCGYHYIAVRMLWDVPDKQFKECYAFLARAIVNLRRHAGQTEKDKAGVRFNRPEGFDL